MVNYFGREYPRTERSFPTGPGSRGGTYHLPEMRREYDRAWRAAHPEYREKERLRKWRKRHPDEEPTQRVLHPAEFCACNCGCRADVVSVCGFCRDGMHQESA